MKTRMHWSAALLLLASVSAHPLEVSQGGYLWMVSEGIENPESAFYDKDNDSIFVSNVAGEGNAKDGKGWISRLGSDGKVKEAQWVKGLNAPKGIRVHKGVLWVSDIDELLAFNIANKKRVARVKIPGAKFLNDVAVGPDGTVYVSDTLGSAIYTYQKGKAKLLVSGDDTESPNGLLIKDKTLYVAAWGKTTDFSTTVPGRLYSYDLADPKKLKKTLITPEPTGNLDGLEQTSGGLFLVSDWNAGKVFQIGPKDKVELLLSGFQGAADLAYLPEQNVVVVPQMKESKISAWSLSKLP